jgi:hypothetical protein
MQLVGSYSNKNYTYTLTRTPIVTKYSLDEKEREEKKYMLAQKAAGITLIFVGVIGSILSGEATILFAALLGIPVTLTKQHVIG